MITKLEIDKKKIEIGTYSLKRTTFLNINILLRLKRGRDLHEREINIFKCKPIFLLCYLARMDSRDPSVFRVLLVKQKLNF